MLSPTPLPVCFSCLSATGWVHFAHLAETDPVALAALITREGTSSLDRACAARELGKAAPPIAGAVLLSLLDDPSPMVREDAVEALGRIGYQGALEAVRHLAESDPAAQVRAAAFLALTHIRSTLPSAPETP